VSIGIQGVVPGQAALFCVVRECCGSIFDCYASYASATLFGTQIQFWPGVGNSFATSSHERKTTANHSGIEFPSASMQLVGSTVTFWFPLGATKSRKFSPARQNVPVRAQATRFIQKLESKDRCMLITNTSIVSIGENVYRLGTTDFHWRT
jgi:hypothetical protein